MATIFSREEKAEALFGEILKNPEACRRLMDTFNDSLDMADVLDAPTMSAQQFAAALFNAYENKDLSAFLMAICQHSMFDLLRNAALIPFKFNADGQPNPVILTDDAGVLLPNNKFAVSSKVYDRFIRVFQKQEKVKMYLASGYCKYHGYDEGSMDVVEYHVSSELNMIWIDFPSYSAPGATSLGTSVSVVFSCAAGAVVSLLVSFAGAAAQAASERIIIRVRSSAITFFIFSSLRFVLIACCNPVCNLTMYILASICKVSMRIFGKNMYISVK